MKTSPRLRRALFGLAIFLFARLWVSVGIEWSVGYHPDELPVAAWVDQVRDTGAVRERAYPGGWFELARLKAWADGRIRRFRNDAARLRAQDGAATTVFPETFRRTPPSGGPVVHDIQWGRDFNALLYALTALLLYLAALEGGLGIAGASVSAAFFLVLPAPLEHAHYCETDLGVLATLALCFWAMVAAVRRRTLPLVLASGLAAGFCASCKYTVAPITLVPAVLAAALGASGRRFGRATSWASLALLAAAIGFVAGTPQLYKAPELLRAAAASPGVRPDALVNFGSGLREMAKAGALPLLWTAVALLFWTRRPWIAAFSGPALFAALFVVFSIFALPWFRNQETLPLLAVFALCAGTPVAAALRAGAVERRRRAPFLAAGAALLVAALASGILASGRMLSAFRVRDTRSLCRDALAAAMPRDARIGFDAYASQATSGLAGEFTDANRLAEGWPESAAVPKVAARRIRYFLRDASHEGRPGRRRERFSGRPVPATAAAIDAFRRDTILLRAWRLPKGKIRPVFAQHDVELRLLPGNDAGAGIPDVPIPFARPVLALPAGVPLYGASGPDAFGPREAMRATGRRTSVLVPCDGSPRWAVAVRDRSSPGPARVEWKGSFRPVSAEPLAPGGAVAAAAPAAATSTAAPGLYRESRVRIRGGGKGDASLVWIASDPAEAAFALRRAGNPADGLALLRAAGALDGTAGVEALLCAVAAGEEPDPAWREAAERALEAFDALRAAADSGPFPGAATVCGVPFEALRDFSRLRVERVSALPGESVGLFAPAGEGYRLTVAFPPSRAPQIVGRILFDGQTGPFVADGDDEGGGVRASAPLRFESDGFLRFRADLPSPEADDIAVLREVELFRDPLVPLADAAGTLREALVTSAR